ncbi:glycoside hydrolase family 16 protein [Granulosicoccus sp. 3-233]|uniref:glycoside hydrolase family 16 protein n=1 Tax=Granulosicoccus sp. 3-233 TaxID=3417969 RepID=UPI003D33EEC9
MKMTCHRRFALLVTLSLLGGAAHAQSEKRILDDRCWDLSFEEPFDTLSLWNESTREGLWRTRYIWPRDVIINDEQQFYIDPEEHGVSPFSIDDGILSIEANPTPRALRGVVSGQPYISGVLTTEKSYSQKYGRFEVSARLPRGGQGLWSAFWLLPSFEQWPEGVAVLPEIDVMESLGHQPNTYHTTLHTNQTGELTSFPFDHTLKADLTRDFHLYSVVWTPETVTWYLDGKRMASHPTPDDYTRPVHFLLNLAVGGSWPGSPDASTEFPASFDIDYVRAWTDNGSCNS